MVRLQAGERLNYDKHNLEILITREAIRQGIDPAVALAVVSVESNFNPTAVGPVGELGLFQIRVPRYEDKYLQPKINIREGVRRLVYWKRNCPSQDGLTWVICYNQGARHPKYPYLHPYYKRIMAVI